MRVPSLFDAGRSFCLIDSEEYAISRGMFCRKTWGASRAGARQSVCFAPFFSEGRLMRRGFIAAYVQSVLWPQSALSAQSVARELSRIAAIHGSLLPLRVLRALRGLSPVRAIREICGSFYFPFIRAICVVCGLSQFQRVGGSTSREDAKSQRGLLLPPFVSIRTDSWILFVFLARLW